MADPFRIRDHVADFDAIVADIVGRSAGTRARLPGLLDLAYGNGSGETLDLFFPPERRPDMPVHIFIHGGYWRMFSKRDYSCIAETITKAGAIAVIVDYALMPGRRMATLVDQMRRARDVVRATIASHGGDPTRLSVSGHSAGAHLASFLFTTDQPPGAIRSAFLLGGIYDLAPLRTSFLQAEIGLTDREVADFSPLHVRHDPSVRTEIVVGAAETPPFHAQAADFAAALAAGGSAVELATLAARNHMDSVRDLALAESEAGRRLIRLIRAS
jgi:arylformamidase